MLRLSELGLGDFKALVLSQESHAMAVFLKFLFNEENLQTWLRPEWMKHYEPSFVDDELVAKARARPPPPSGRTGGLRHAGWYAESARTGTTMQESVRMDTATQEGVRASTATRESVMTGTATQENVRTGTAAQEGVRTGTAPQQDERAGTTTPEGARTGTATQAGE